MHAFVLHLTRARARRDNARALLKTCGVPGEIWEAVDGKSLSSQDFSAPLVDHLFEPTYPFPLNPGEVGVFLSQRQIWAEIVRRDLDCALIFEDDVALDPELFAPALRLAMRNVPAFGYVQLQNRPVDGQPKVLDIEGPALLTSPTVTPLRASAQVISASAARRLHEMTRRFDRPVDTFVQSHWHTGLRPGVVYPSGVSTISEQLDGSTIQTNKERGVLQIAKREAARLFYRRKVDQYSRQSPAVVPGNEAPS
jgi:GR25 family glycosyltransferase involved in LPS biosynthesis